MIFQSRFLAVASLIGFCSLAAPPVQAGQLFPPDNIGPNPNISCPHGGVLTWHRDRVDCVNPTLGVSVSCPEGQVLTGILNGVPRCVSMPASGTDQAVHPPAPVPDSNCNSQSVSWPSPSGAKCYGTAQFTNSLSVVYVGNENPGLWGGANFVCQNGAFVPFGPVMPCMDVVSPSGPAMP